MCYGSKKIGWQSAEGSSYKIVATAVPLVNAGIPRTRKSYSGIVIFKASSLLQFGINVADPDH